MPNGDRKPFDMSERLFWWVRFLGAVLLVSGFALGVGKWVYTRASVDEVAAVKQHVDAEVAKREPITHAREVEQRIEQQMATQRQVLGNVRDNLIILMDRQRVESKPLPPQVGAP